MQLAAIYLDSHEYDSSEQPLCGKPQTVNFGTRYFYSFKKQDEETIHVSIEENPNYIDGLFDMTKIDSKLTNINCIVGQNGAGKTTLLNLIRNQFNIYPYPSQSLFIIEDSSSEYPFILSSSFEKVYLIRPQKRKKLLRTINNKKVQTIYYSPHYNFSFNANYDNIDDHDISFEQTVEKDLNGFYEDSLTSNASELSASRELLLQNSIRQIQFLSSDIVNDYNVFKDVLYLPGHHNPVLYFNKCSIKKTFHDSPYLFRDVIKVLAEKIRIELDSNNVNTHLSKFNNHKQREVENLRYELKRRILECIVAKISIQIEKDGVFLQHGYFPGEAVDKMTTQNAYDCFISFIENSEITIIPENNYKIFDAKVYIDFLEKLYKTIDECENGTLMGKARMSVTKEDAIEILQLQRKVTIDLGNYFNKVYANADKIINKDYHKVNDFIQYMPFRQRLSSGENALLNLFARLYDFIQSNIVQYQSREPKDHYIILLDEADLAFHPEWKKKYIYALTKTLPYFFNEIKTKPSIEIIYTTHDPISLSDMPNTNVVYIERPSYDEISTIMDYNDIRRPDKSFAANISNLIADSFFINGLLIGNFANEKIKEIIQWLENKDNKESHDKYKKMINLIDEPIMQRKLAEMYDDKMGSDLRTSVIDKQIEQLEKLKQQQKR